MSTIVKLSVKVVKNLFKEPIAIEVRCDRDAVPFSIYLAELKKWAEKRDNKSILRKLLRDNPGSSIKLFCKIGGRYRGPWYISKDYWVDYLRSINEEPLYPARGEEQE